MVVELIGKGRRVPVAERVKAWWIGVEEPVVPAARLLEKPMTHAHPAALAAEVRPLNPTRFDATLPQSAGRGKQ